MYGILTRAANDPYGQGSPGASTTAPVMASLSGRGRVAWSPSAFLRRAGPFAPLSREGVLLAARHRLDEAGAAEAEGGPVFVDRDHTHRLETRLAERVPAGIAVEV